MEIEVIDSKLRPLSRTALPLAEESSISMEYIGNSWQMHDYGFDLYAERENATFRVFILYPEIDAMELKFQ
ncbi:hypothetical protein M0802_006201 [Mischocyttarus mexicanus]|nr:hypothetical protein M0802_006201 [Mischocyttarus mexicanus]